MRLLRISSCKSVCLGFCALLVFVIPFLVLFAWIPYTRALNHELTFFEELKRLEDIELLWDAHPELWGVMENPLPSAKDRLMPMIHDVAQLTSWGYEGQMEMHEDGTAQQPGNQAWIYVGGTAQKRTLYERMGLFTAPNGSCVDEPHICNSFNDGFNQLVEQDHRASLQTSTMGYGFMDCDVSPLLCDHFGIDPVMMIHLETKTPCRIDLKPKYKRSCSVTRSLIGLPLKHMPFSKQINISGNIVPVFPSAFEQLSAMVTLDGSTKGIGLHESHIREIIVKENKEAKIRPASKESKSFPTRTRHLNATIHSRSPLGQ